MPDTSSIPETTLKSFYTSLYPDLTNDTQPSLYPSLESFQFSQNSQTLDPELSKAPTLFCTIGQIQ